MSNELNIFNLVDNQKSLFIPVISDDQIIWEKEKQFAIQALQNNKRLADTAFQNMSSFENAIINIASFGISLNPAAKHAYLVPRDGKVCLDISYIGLLHLAMSSGAIKWGQCKIVFADDRYENNGIDLAPLHIYNSFSERGKIVGAYCTVKTIDGDYLTDEMSIAEINLISELSKSKNSFYSPWNKHFNEMARKTVVKRAAKYWPSAQRLSGAINYLNESANEGIGFNEKDPDVINLISEKCQLELNDLIANSGRTLEQYLMWASSAFKRDIKLISELSESEFNKSKNMMSNL